MLTSRQLALFGFPLILFLLIATVFEQARTDTELYNEYGRNNCRQRLERIFARAQEVIEKNILEKTKQLLQQQREIEARSLLFAQKAAEILSLNIRQMEKDNRAKLQNQLTDLEKIALSFGLLTPTFNHTSLSQPVSAILESKEKLLTLLPKRGSILSIYNHNGILIWQNQNRQNQQNYTVPASHEFFFNWEGKTSSWKISVSRILRSPAQELTPDQVFAQLQSDPDMHKYLGENFTLAITNLLGNVLFTLPDNSFPVDNLRQGDLNLWQEKDKGVFDKPHLAYLENRKIKSNASYRFLGQAINIEKTPAFWLLDTLEHKPLQLAPLLGGILFCLLAISWLSLRRKPQRSQDATETTGNIHLVRKGERCIPEDSAIVVAEIGKNGTAVEVSAFKGVTYPPEDRDSNLKHLRNLYANGDSQKLDLQNRVRSEVLKDLLREVGKPVVVKEED